jgi:hypothetical protein
MSEEQQVGYSEEYQRWTKWYYWHRFSLLPQWRYRPRDEQNCSAFSFHWGVFRLWTMMSPDLGASVELNDRDLEIRVRLPYLITGLFIPVFPQIFSHKLWRRGTRKW